MKNTKTKKPSLKKLEFTALSFLALALVLFCFSPALSGFIFVNTHAQKLNLTINETSAFLITSEEPLKVTSFKISGKITGGIVNIYLDNMEGQKVLVYDNFEDKEESGISSIIGKITEELPAKESKNDKKEKVLEFDLLEKFDERINSIDKADKEVITGSFEDACKETCFIKMNVNPKENYRLVILLEEGAVLELKEIKFTIDDE